VLWDALHIEHLGEHPIAFSFPWLPIGIDGSAAFHMGGSIDPLGAVLLFFVPLTATMIFIYSTGYMASGHYWTAHTDHGNSEYPFARPEDGSQSVAAHADAHGDAHDSSHGGGHGGGGHDDYVVDSTGRKLVRFDATVWKARFMAFISLFAGAMLILTIADNLLMLFVGWEIMGACSYLLIGFWNNRVYPDEPRRITPPLAAIKAFMTTRVADVFMLIGIAWLYSFTGTLNFREIFFNEETMNALANTMAFPSIAFLAGLPVASAIGLLLMTGTVGKSAQFPLHTWLPDAMEGPTPVSAMIHAATMVSAGVYMLLRMYPLLSLGAGEHSLSIPMTAMAAIGTFTALFAATIALAQRDVKKVLAYSTISQLGFMVAAIGIGAFIAAAFHLMTHAIFKALLFMGSGSIIHAVEHGEEHAHHHGHHFPLTFDAQDMFNMGGLWSRIPATAWTFLIGGLSLAGLPLVTAGFWSKDEILADAWAHQQIVFWVLLFTAFLTAFYTMRQIALTFFGEPRTHAADDATQNDLRMNLPLWFLAFFAIVIGWLGIPEGFPVIGHILNNPFHEFVAGALPEHPETLLFDWRPAAMGSLASIIGLSLGWLVYGRRPLAAGEVDPLQRALGPLYTLFQNKYYLDQLYERSFVAFSVWFSETIAYRFFDQTIINGILHAVARATEWLAFRNKDFDTYIVNGAGDELPRRIGILGESFKYVQSGRVQQYLAVAAAGLLMLAGVFVWALFLR
jgi:NADH-quinone oxidoreductase subunit L